MKRKHSFREIVMTSASVLLCLTLISTYLTAEMFARFVSSDSGSDSARVATFNVSETGKLTEKFAAELVPGVPCEKNITVVNESEVAVAYTITIQNHSNNMDLSFQFGKDGAMEPMTDSGDGCSITTAIPPSTTVSDYKLEILWNSQGEAIDLAYMGCVELITITLTAAQID